MRRHRADRPLKGRQIHRNTAASWRRQQHPAPPFTAVGVEKRPDFSVVRNELQLQGSFTAAKEK